MVSRYGSTLMLLLLASPAAAEPAHFPRWAFVADVRTAVGVASTTDASRAPEAKAMFILPSLTVGARLVNRLELRIGYLPLVHFVIVPDGSGHHVIHTGVLSTTVDLIQFLRNRGNWFLVGGMYAGTSDVGFARNEALVGYNFATGVRFLLARFFALGFELGALGDVTNPGSSDEQQTHGGYFAIDGTFYAGR
jgi:hypothetical protein